MSQPITEIDPKIESEMTGITPVGSPPVIVAPPVIAIDSVAVPPVKTFTVDEYKEMIKQGKIFKFEDIAPTSPPSPNKKILTHVGLLKDGKISQKAKDRFIDSVVAVVAGGNNNGKMPGVIPIDPSLPTFLDLVGVGMPPSPAGVKFLNFSTFKMEDQFWFDPDPVLAVLYTDMKNIEKYQPWHSVWIDTLYEGMANALDVVGNTPFFPLIDWTFAFPGISIPLNLGLQFVSYMLNLPTLDFMVKLPGIGFKIPPTLPPFPPSFKLPTLSLPSLSLDINFNLKILFELFLKLPSIILDLIVKFPNINLPMFGLPSLVIKLIFNLILPFFKIVPIVPKLIVATLLVLIKNLVGMIVCDIIGLVVGTGTIVTAAATKLGLV